ncbi:hypothetical protein KDW_02400 [Dictyobacter vulcani]|uniref:Transposase IS116/IS110/IS902 C-terminal domain-containing protein n=1 Tax=Dictyobacter vulcani TaxID=2607529 RepID=A0A5J4KBU6_9CHLR|nr:transposase [Dictyobacter vulcani]GER86078.1 hypothetical protein KDW_02400 [Dictyobacter vulcani]
MALDLFGKLQQPSTIHFLRTYPTPQQATSDSVEQLAATLKQTCYLGASQAAQQMVLRLHQPHLSANEVTTRTKSRLMLALLAQLEPLIQQIVNYDKEIKHLFLMHADSELFQALPGAGKRLAPRLLAQIGDARTRYTTSASLQSLAGTSPVLFQNGTYSKAYRRLGVYQTLALLQRGVFYNVCSSISKLRSLIMRQVSSYS